MISILYIGNDPLLTGEMTRTFQTDPDWICDVLRSGGEALDRLKTNQYSVVVAEYELPDMDGFTLLKRLRSSGNRVPYLLCAGKLHDGVRHQVTAMGGEIWHRSAQPTALQISGLMTTILQSAGSHCSGRVIPEGRGDPFEPVLRSPVGHEPARDNRMSEDPLLNDIVSCVPDGISVLDPELTILQVNDTVERWFAHEIPLIGKKCFQAYYAKEEPCEVCPSCEAIRTGQTTYAVMPRMGPDANIMGWLDVCSIPITDKDGNATAVIEYLTEITERKRIRKLLADERSMLNAGPTVIITWKSVPGKAVLYVTPNVKEQFGYNPDDLHSGTVLYTDLVHPDNLPGVVQEIESHLNDKSAFRLKPYRIRKEDGSYGWVTDYITVIPDQEGKSCTYRSYLNDVTEIKETGELHRQNEILFGIATETAGIGVWESNLVTGQRRCINKVSDLFGYRDEEIDELFRTYDQYMHPDDRIAITEAFRHQVTTKSPFFEFESRIRGKDGAWHWLNIRGTVATRDEQGNPVRVIGTFRDITGLKSDRDAIQAANEKLNLLGSVTRHDILNQVMVALGYLALLDEMVPAGSELQEFCRKATEATKRIQRQITFTRDYQNLGVRSPEWQLVTDTVHHSADACSGIRIMVKTGSLEIFADPLLERVFFNLFDNAMRHGDHVTEIVIGFHEEKDRGILTVEDNGIGIPDDRKIPVFERGYGRNSGLGLFLAREILDITGLCIREAGVPGKGARFEITVPVGLYRFAGRPGNE